MTVILTFVLIGIFSVSGVAGYVIYNMYEDVDGILLVDLFDYISNQGKTTFIYGPEDKDGNKIQLASLHAEQNRIWLELKDMPQNIIDAFIALEDKRFYDHSGVDWIRTMKVMYYTAFQLKVQGGSTITQQLIKNLTGDDDDSFYRKYSEIVRALNVEKHFNKDTILESYLNTLYLDQSCYGIETASQYYFGKQAKDLNIAESACLAAITKAPRTYNPILNFEENRSRQRLCLDYMYEQGKITEQEMQEAKDYELVFVGDSSVTRNIEGKTSINYGGDVQSYYIDYVIQQVIEDLMTKYGYTKEEATHKIYYGGLNIYAAVDIEIQKLLEDIYYNRKGFPSEADTKKNPAAQSAMTIVDYKGRLVGIVGGAGKKTGQRTKNIAANFPRQPGSSIKPLSVYAPVINENLANWSSKFQNYGVMTINGKSWPHNVGGDAGSPNSYLTLAGAIPKSYNTVPAQILKNKLSLDISFNYLQKNFHIKKLVDADLDYSPLAVGGMSYGTTTLEMAAAYATFGNGGTYYRPYSYYYVNDYAEKVSVLEPDYKGEQAIEPDTADIMVKLLKQVTDASLVGTGRNYVVKNFANKMYCKTGTTTDDYDRWFIGATPYYVCAVWYGYDKPKEINYSGGNPAGMLFQKVMNEIHSNLDNDVDFESHSDIVSVRYCNGSGLKANSQCGSTSVGWYRKSFIPSTCTNCNPFGAVEETSNPEGETGETTGVQGETVEPATVAPTAPPATKPPETTTSNKVIISTAPGFEGRDDE